MTVNGRTRVLTAAGAVVLATTAALACACSRSGGALVVSGRIRDETVSVRAPLPTPSASSASSSATASSRTAASLSPKVAGIVASVAVSPGQSVRAGDVLATLDTTLERYQLQTAEAVAREASAQAEVVADRVSELADKRADLRDKRAEIVSGLGKAASARAQLGSQLAQARALARRRSGGAGPPGGAPGQATPNPAVMVAKLEAALAQLKVKEARARAGLAKIDAARDTLAEADRTLTDVRDLATIRAQGMHLGVEVARARLALRTLRAPEDALVLECPQPGELVMANAPVIVLRPTRPEKVDVYVTSAQAEGLSEGTAASVRVDSFPGKVFDAKVTRIGHSLEFVPTSFATSIVHLARGLRVTLTLTGGHLPPGTPADVKFTLDGGPSAR